MKVGCKNAIKKQICRFFTTHFEIFSDFALFGVLGFHVIALPVFPDVVLPFHLDGSFFLAFDFDAFVSLRGLLSNVKLPFKQLSAVCIKPVLLYKDVWRDTRGFFFQECINALLPIFQQYGTRQRKG